MSGLMTFGEILLILSLIGLIGVVIWLVVTVLNLKNGVTRDAKRIYERPLRSVKSLAATGKGIVMQEGVRVKHIGASGKVAAIAVRDAAIEIKTAVQGIPVDDLKAMTTEIKSTAKLVGTATQFFRAVSKQRAE